MKPFSPHWFRLGLIVVLVAAVVLFAWVATKLLQPVEFVPTQYGVTFSITYAKQLGLDPAESYRALVEDVGVRRVRLPVYWSEIEHDPGVFDWTLLDQLVNYSDVRGVDLTLVVGVKVPRWPECYVPDWAEMMDDGARHEAALSMVRAVIERYKNVKTISRWQVENEPFFPFGECPNLSVAQFRQRVDLVRTLDPSRPIQVTVSGELGPWGTESDAADILGISMYRLTWNDLFGYFMYPLTPEYYYARAQLAGSSVDRVIVSELQAEPWFPESIASRSLDHWYRAFDVETFRQNIRFVEESHLSEVYLWGAEWWYFLKEHGREELWNEAKNLF